MPRALRRVGVGRYLLELHEKEVKLLSALVKMLAEEISNTENERLYPEAHPTSDDLQQEYASLTARSLAQSRCDIINDFAEQSERQLLTLEELGSWLSASSVLRLTLGTVLERDGVDLENVTECFEQIIASREAESQDLADRGSANENVANQGSPNQGACMAAYVILTSIVEEVSQFLLAQQIREADSRA